ncbi:MAG: TlpA disulfide reductase family protein [Sediminibacterium sp.]
MKCSFLLLLAATMFFTSSCNTAGNKNESNKNGDTTFIVDWTSLSKDFLTWYNYTYTNVPLSQDFIGLDVDSAKIDKPAFLAKLLKDDVVAYKIMISQGIPVYKLFAIKPDEAIQTTARQMAETAIAHLKMEGTQIPDFHFTDLDGKEYDKTSTKGKILVLKCWFIRCGACVKEFPDLNKLVDEYKNRNDVLFVSLAIDSKQDLVNFLKTKKFSYTTVPGMSDYMSYQLNVSEYPTHLLIDKNGKILKVVNRIEELVPFLKKEAS